jgi:hypothetical protein
MSPAAAAEATGLMPESVDPFSAPSPFMVPARGGASSSRGFSKRRRPPGQSESSQRSRPIPAGYRQAILDVGGETAAERMGFDPAVIARAGLFRLPNG